MNYSIEHNEIICREYKKTKHEEEFLYIDDVW